jgi:hypothetical protein
MDALIATTAGILLGLGLMLSANAYMNREWWPMGIVRAVITAGFICILSAMILVEMAG